VPIEVYNLKLGILYIFVRTERVNMEYLTVTQVAEKWGIKQRRIRVLCSENRIEGARKVGSYWLIPEEAKKPKDERIKSGKYIKVDNGNDLT
jgi:excisionase family DNA binding protein